MAATTTAQPVSVLSPSSFCFVERGLRRSNSSSHLRKPRISHRRPNSSAGPSEMSSFGTMSLYLSEKVPATIGGKKSSSSSRPTTPTPPADSARLSFFDKVPSTIRKRTSSRPSTAGGEVNHRASILEDEKTDDEEISKRGSRFLAGGLRRVRSKRSLCRLNPSSANDGAGPSSADRPSTTPPTDKKRVSVVPEGDAEVQEDGKADGFQRRNRFVTKDGMRHHPYPDEAPYMQAYDPVLLENDRLTEVLLQKINSNGSPTFHDYGVKPPMNVLDLGCGFGRWVVEAAVTWKSFGTQVTGLDLVDVSKLNSELDGASLDNITWVRGNFLRHHLPFADDSFDLVRMANLSLAIPRDSWLPLFEEVRRVLAPNGRLELIDDQIIFPYDDPPTVAPTSPKKSPHLRRKSSSSFDDSESDDSGVDDSEVVDEPQESPQPLDKDTVAEWKAHAGSSKGLETIFESMLQKKYAIESQPQDAIDITLGRVFGSQHTDQIKNMRLALAPSDEEDLDLLMNRSSIASSDSGLGSSESETSFKLPASQDEDRPVRPERRPSHQLGLEFDNISPKAAMFLGIDSEPKTESNHSIPTTSERPENRRLGRLKLSPSKIWREKFSERVRGRKKSIDITRKDVPEIISPKAAEYLGISPTDRPSGENHDSQGRQSGDAHSIGHSSVDSSRRDSIGPEAIKTRIAERLPLNPYLGTSQSPGLVLWPSTFIPMEPLELEMHACKNMHLLLGCKAALSEFIQEIKGPDGKSHISREEFNELTWEYECFRRKRFNWPEEIPRSRPLMLPTTPYNTAPRSSSARPSTSSGLAPASTSAGAEPTLIRRATTANFRRPTSSYGRPRRVSSHSQSPAPAYKRENLTFVRVFRVYEAHNIV